jgi:hypothetical protein
LVADEIRRLPLTRIGREVDAVDFDPGVLCDSSSFTGRVRDRRNKRIDDDATLVTLLAAADAAPPPDTVTKLVT